jgi:hypothetical protein
MSKWIVLILVLIAVALIAAGALPLFQPADSGIQCMDCAMMCKTQTGEEACGSNCSGNVNYVEKMRAQGWVSCTWEKFKQN